MLRKVLLHKEGPALWPGHKPLSEVLSLRDTTPDRTWEGTYQGNPMSPQGSVFKRSWWAEGRSRYDWVNEVIPRKVIARWISFDTALKENMDSAFSSAIVGELWPDYRLAIRDVWRGRVPFPELSPQIAHLSKQWNYDGKLRNVLIEDKASGISAIQTLRSAVEYDWIAEILVAFNPSVDKETRATQASVWCRNGMVLLPQPGPEWLFDFEDELFGFPSAIYADQVDAFSQLVLYLEHLLAEGFQLRAGNRRPELPAGMEDDYGSERSA